VISTPEATVLSVSASPSTIQNPNSKNGTSHIHLPGSTAVSSLNS